MNGQNRQGQALTELLIGLVAIVVVLAFLLQSGRLLRARTNALHRARAEAGSAALSSVYSRYVPGPIFGGDWSDGPDGRAYSRDDRLRRGNPLPLRLVVAANARPEELDRHVADNAFRAVQNDPEVVDQFWLTCGRARSESVPLLPVIRALLYRADEITFDETVWLTWCEGLPGR